MKTIFSVLLGLALFTSPAIGKSFKIGALVPDGTSWAKNLRGMAKEIEKATDKRVKFKLYLGGVAGDEPDVLRKIRVGQFHGGIFTGKALGEIYGDIRLLELPFNFQSRQKALKVLEGMQPHFLKGLDSKGFQGLGFFELGQVYIVSKKEVTNLDNLRGIKIWSWEGDKLVEAIMSNLNLVSTSLALPDVLTSLQTGMIESAYATPLAIIALQWQSKVQYLIDFPVTYTFGGLVLSKRAWKKIDGKDQQKIISISNKWVKKTNDKTIEENATSLQALKGSGIKFVKFPDSDLSKGNVVREKVLKELTGKLFTPEGKALFLKQMKAAG